MTAPGDWSRRDVLAAFLGAPIALAACAGPSSRRVPPGSIVGASLQLGHLLRGRPRLELPAERLEPVDALIVGGGVAGLAAAWRLRRAGVERVQIVELEPELGGTARSGDSPIGAYPWGAHYLPLPLKENRALVALLEEMRVLDGVDRDGEPAAREEHRVHEPDERIFFRGHWYEGLYLHSGASAEDLRQLRAFEAEVGRWADYRDTRGRPAFALPSARASREGEPLALDRVTFGAWAHGRGFTSERLLWLLDYAVRDDYGMRLGDVSAWAGLFYFAARLRKVGGETQPFLTWPEGNGRLVRHLREALSARSRTGVVVTDVVPGNEAGAGWIEVLAVAARTGEPLGWRARRVVLAVPQFVARRVVRGWSESPPAHIAEFSYGAWMVANLFLRERPLERGFPLAWDNVLVESPSLGYVVNTHQLGLDRGPCVFTYYYPLCDPDPRAARERLLALGYDEWADVALTDLERAHPGLREDVERMEIVRWGHAMVRPRPGLIGGGALERALVPYRGIHFAHSDLSGLALFEEAFHHGVRAAEEVCEGLGVKTGSLL